MSAPFEAGAAAPKIKPGIRGHIQIARFDHWVKNVFVLPGILVALSVVGPVDWPQLLLRTIVGLVAVGLIASSNYIINEVLDAPFDRSHPIKRMRPVPSGQVSVPLAYVQWLAFMGAGMALSFWISNWFAATMAALWIMGLVYNIPPIRSKDKPYLDVVSESVNNPIRMLAGWYIVLSRVPPPASLLVCYWMIGCYFMAIKRFAEYKEIGDAVRATAYRRSFAFYNERRLLVSIMFYASFAMLAFGAFIVRYRLELALAFPLVALVMAVYLNLAFDPHSAAQNPEHLYRQPALMGAVVVCAAAMVVLLFVNVPAIYQIFTPLNSGVPPSLK